MASAVGLQQLLRMQGLQWGDGASGDKHLWLDSVGLNVDGAVTQTQNAVNTSPLYQVSDSGGNTIVSVRSDIPATPTAGQNTFFISGQHPATLTSLVDSYIFHVRGSGQGSSTAAGQMVARFHFKAVTDAPYLTNYSGNQLAAAVNAQTDSTSTGITPVSGLTGNAGAIALANGTTAGWNMGVWGIAKSSSVTNIGVLGSAISVTNTPAWNVGVMGVAREASTISNSGYFYVGTTEPTVGSASCVTLDVASTAVPMLLGVLAGVTRFTLDSKGNITMAPSTTGGGLTTLGITPPASGTVVAETNDVLVAAHTMTITGGYNLQRFVHLQQPTVSAATALTIVTGATFGVAGPPLVTGAGPAAITNKVSIWAATDIATVAGGSPNAAIGIGVTTNAPTAGIYWGSGAPTIAAPKGSLYIRTDGTTTNDRAYINTNASTTWTAITTAA